jgi:hypothetical protein
LQAFQLPLQRSQLVQQARNADLCHYGARVHALRCLRLCPRAIRRSQPALLGGSAALLQLSYSRLRHRRVASLGRRSGLSVSGSAFQCIDAPRVLLHIP